MEKDMLIKLWMAQGFLGETQGHDIEIVGEEYFDNLARRFFFQEFEKDANDDSIITKCKMHDIVKDFAQLLTKTQCCIVASNGTKERRVDFYHETVRHLTIIRDNYALGGIPYPVYNSKKLRSLLVASRYYHTSTLEAYLPKLFVRLPCLRMLSLSNSSDLCSFKELLEEIGELIHLRYLILEGNAELCELPEAVCDLCNLQTLNIRSCYKLRKLPNGMEKLINLRHLQNAYVNRRLLMPKGMQRLTRLQTLEEFRVKEGGGIESETSFNLANLGKLTYLRGNVSIKALGNVGDASEAREAQLSAKTGLRALILNFDGGYDKKQHTGIEDEAFILEALQPPQQLQSLQIECCKAPGFPFPNWMMSLTSLKNVVLCRCENCESLPPMGKLPSLESLSIQGMVKVKKVGEEFVGFETSSYSVSHNIAFPNLKKLTFRNMKGWEEWECKKVLRSRGEDDSSSSNYISIMPKLELLSLVYCPELKMLPHHLLQIRALKELEITECPYLFWRFNEERGDNCPSIAHIPTVKISRW